MARVTFPLLRNGKRIGSASFTGRNRKAAIRTGSRVLRNVAGGFVDSKGRFHPIRKSRDYSAKRAGERKRSKRRRNLGDPHRWMVGRYGDGGSFATRAKAEERARKMTAAHERYRGSNEPSLDSTVYDTSTGEAISSFRAGKRVRIR